MSTVFTKIIDGEIPGRFIWADETCVAFSTIAPITDGHALVVPREEVDHFTDAADDLLAHLSIVSKWIGAAQRTAFASPRAALIIAGFEVPHLHLHVMPVWNEAEMKFENARSDVPAGRLDAAAEKVRSALQDAGFGANVPAELGSPALG